MDLSKAIEKHSEWKIKFRTAISAHETMDAATIGRDDACELGKWLHGDGKREHGTLASHRDCVAKHAQFHREAGKVAQLINAQKFDEATTALGAATPYGQASSAVGVAILAFKREAGI